VKFIKLEGKKNPLISSALLIDEYGQEDTIDINLSLAFAFAVQDFYG
jgi:hypothetical protein